MSSSKRYGDQKRSAVLRYLYFLIFGLLAAWLIASIVSEKSPIDLVRNSVSTIGDKVGSANEEKQATLVSEKDSIISKLENDLAICRGEKSFHKAMVMIDSKHLNMRSNPSLNASVVMQIPAESMVDIYYYDTKTYYLEGVPGNWAKIRYADQEGWVWGNFLVKISDDKIEE